MRRRVEVAICRPDDDDGVADYIAPHAQQLQQQRIVTAHRRLPTVDGRVEYRGFVITVRIADCRSRVGIRQRASLRGPAASLDGRTYVTSLVTGDEVRQVATRSTCCQEAYHGEATGYRVTVSVSDRFQYLHDIKECQTRTPKCTAGTCCKV